MSVNISNNTMETSYEYLIESPTSDDMLRVWIYIFVNLIQLIPYVLILWVIYKDSKTYDAPVYKIIFHLGIADCIILVFHLSELPFTIFQVSVDFWAVKLCGAILNGTVYSFIHFTLLLAFNRFVTISLHPNSVKTINSKVLEFWIRLTWLWGVLVMVWFLSPFCSVYFDVKTLSWGFLSEKIGGIMPYIDLGICGIQFLLATIIYLLTILKLVLIKSTFNANNDSRNEIKLLIQAIIIGIYGAFVALYWNFIYVYMDSSYSDFLGNLLWIIQNGMNPFLYLAMNPRIRKSFTQFISSKFKNSPTPNATQQHNKIHVIKSLKTGTINVGTVTRNSIK